MALTAAALTTLDEAKTELGIALGDPTYDTTLERIIEAMSAKFAAACNRQFEFGTGIVELVAGYGDTKLSISRMPLKAISEVLETDTGTVVDTALYAIHGEGDEGLIHADVGWLWTTSGIQNITFNPVPAQEERSYQVTYDGGWVTPQQVILDGALTRDLPFDIEDAVIQLVTARFNSRGGAPIEAGPIESEGLITHKVSYAGGSDIGDGVVFASAMSGDIAATIARYARPASV